jgi:hypothetical protein
MLFESFRGVRGDSQGSDVENFGIAESLGIRFDIIDQRLHQMLRFRAGRTDENRISPMNAAEDYILRGKLFRIFISPNFQIHALSLIFMPVTEH